LLKTASIGLAPYKDLPDSFSIYADPSKIKNYAQFGIPFVMTNVPKVSSEFRSHKIGVVVDDNLDDLSAAALNLLELEGLWKEQSDSIFKYAKSITWSTVLEDFTEELRRL
jgi:glycosyltransferase involved in cell wall biosynthesis